MTEQFEESQSPAPSDNKTARKIIEIDGTAYDAVLIYDSNVREDASRTRVYRVDNDPKLKRAVILKEMFDESGNAAKRAEVHERAQREAELMEEIQRKGKRNDPHLPRFYDRMTSDPTRVWLKIQYISGQTLRQKFDSVTEVNSVKWISDLLDIALSVAQGLKAFHFHQKRYAHRDVTPSNIQITPDNRVFLIDVGVGALPNSDSWGLVTGKTQIALDEGTPGYHAPEQTGRREPTETPGTESDIYSLGVIIYEGLTKRIYRHAKQTEPLVALNDAVSAELNTLVISMLSRTMTERPPIGKVIKKIIRIRKSDYAQHDSNPDSSTIAGDEVTEQSPTEPEQTPEVAEVNSDLTPFAPDLSGLLNENIKRFDPVTYVLPQFPDIIPSLPRTVIMRSLVGTSILFGTVLLALSLLFGRLQTASNPEIAVNSLDTLLISTVTPLVPVSSVAEQPLSTASPLPEDLATLLPEIGRVLPTPFLGIIDQSLVPDSAMPALQPSPRTAITLVNVLLRPEPNTLQQSLMRIPKNSCVRIITDAIEEPPHDGNASTCAESSAIWYSVSFQDQQGFLCGRLLQIAECVP